ncbi:Por secretion system C-terminal sorting domain-containing protein [Dokdonia pacifica]|uniref:Por secretion system C-terminal sorting domain-containing protein n=2 Tax=Dokdonia pacifica TaxID=1627892 RepID=A0A239D3F1_9FLAO|nr:Por secretion system C-terminal sorting domain-containing protein [Dokdonia pacifica]
MLDVSSNFKNLLNQLSMKQITLYIVMLLGGLTINAQNIELSFENPQITNDGMNDFYEIDVMITSDITYSQGSGQFFLDYNTTAFGELVNGAGAITFERPETTILGGVTTVEVAPGTIIPLGVHYNSFFINDATTSKVSFIWQQNGSGGMIGNNIVANTPTVLVHVRLQFLDGASAVSPDLCFDATNPFDDQFFTACGPFDPLVGFTFVNADCINEAGNQILNYTPDCTIPDPPLCAGLPVTTYTAMGWDNGAPDSMTNAVIDSNYDTSTVDADIVACSCTINSGATVTVTAGRYVQTTGDLTIDGTLDVAHEGSVVQTDESAVTINNGSISVAKTTPTLDDRNFVAMSSPVTAEARDRAYGNSRAVFSIIPSNFVPFDIDLMAFPEFMGAENFLDDDNDYLLPVSGSTALPDAGIGQLVFPQPAPNVGDGAYTITYTQNAMNPGTLNSGTITVPINYNGPATINNYNLLGNPYASAIDVEAFINANDAVNEVYYWDHLTNPTSDLPGFGTSNFSMNDISVRNALLGVAAVNGGAAPGQFMASGQGFGIKAAQTEAGANTPVVFTNSIRVTGNNDGFRNAENSDIDRIWLNLTTEAYEEATSQTGIGFTPNATPGFDPGYDSPRLGTFISLFTTLETGEQLSIQGREAFDTEIEISLGFATSVETEESYAISIDHLEGVGIENATMYLIDNLTNTTTNLNEGRYSFTATSGIQPERFTVIFQKRDVLSTDEFSFRESVTLYPNPATNQVTLGYVGQAQLQKLTIIDMNGKVIRIVSLENFQSSQLIQTSDLAKGMYFLNIQSNKDTIVQKLIIK